MSDINAARYPALRDMSPAAQAAAQWFRTLARMLRLCRLYRTGSDVAGEARDKVYDLLKQMLEIHETLAFRVTAAEIFLIDEPVVRPTVVKHGEGAIPGKEEELPFHLYRDGIRGLMFLKGLPKQEFDVFFEAMIVTGIGRLTQDDLVTLLWQANLHYLRVEAVPPEQTIYLSSRKPSGKRRSGNAQGLAYSLSPSGDEIHADLGQLDGVAQGLHRDTFDDWEMPVVSVEVSAAYDSIAPLADASRLELLEDWANEQTKPWPRQVDDLIRCLLASDPSDEMLGLLARAASTWLASTIQRCTWEEAQEAFTLLRELDPDGQRADEMLAGAIAALDSAQIIEHLDESATDDRAKFFALMVAIGKPTFDLTCAVMAGAEKSRTRAAAVTTLCYLCSDDPSLLEPYLNDSRWFVVRNVVFVLGQIGGPGIIAMIGQVSHHPDTRVRRQVVQSLGSVSHEERRSILLDQLDTRDAQLLAATLNMLTRQKDRKVSRAILAQIQAPDFDSRSDENQRALFGALGEVAGNEAISVLSDLLLRGGWFARRTLERSYAARTLLRIGTDRSTAVVQAGLRSTNEAVRNACLEASSARIGL
jgi:HEAT repeats